MLSVPHMIVVFVVVLVVFGPKKLPELARGLGKLMAEFRKASTDFKSAFEEEMRDLERQALLAERKKAAEAVAAGEPAQSATVPASSEPGTPANEASQPAAASETPVITPVAGSVARGSEGSAENGTEAAAANLQESPESARHPV
ncbi:MAG TPA: twin-arginine translocase TatA/TatE family subunit [Candidatus Acidoferrum sp.]|nr:twin-arginine translocase TatA/TatE family subunit [Candidatus Acidoferrum sp.]